MKMKKRFKHLFMYQEWSSSIWHWRSWARNVGYGVCGAVGASLVLVPVWVVAVKVFG